MNEYLLIIVFMLYLKSTEEHVKRDTTGHRAKLGQFPFFASLELLDINRTDQTTRICGASLISPAWILSAALCFLITDVEDTKFDVIPIVAKMGFVDDEDSSAEIYTLKKIIMHPAYRVEYNYKDKRELTEDNIALARLNATVNKNNVIQPINLPSQKSVDEPCENSILIVLGQTKFNNISDYLLYANVNVKTSKDIAVEFDSRRNFNSKLLVINSPDMLNFKMEGNNIDAGSPLVCVFGQKRFQIGLYSNTIEVITKNVTVSVFVYEDISKHINFISKHIFKLHDEETRSDEQELSSEKENSRLNDKGTLDDERHTPAHRAKLGQFPFFASLELLDVNETDQTTRICGASLISPTWILSAALCFLITDVEDTQFDVIPIVAKMGFVDDEDSSAEIYTLKKIIMHPAYRVEYNYKDKRELTEDNIALARLNATVNKNNVIQPINLPSQKSVDEPCENSILIVLGQTKFNNISDYLLYARIDDEDSSAEIYTIKEIIMHPDYRVEYRYQGKRQLTEDNIALGRLNKTVNINDVIRPIDLPLQKSVDKPCKNSILIIVGKIDSNNISDYVLYSKVSVKTSKDLSLERSRSFNSKLFSSNSHDILIFKIEGNSVDAGNPLICFIGNKSFQTGLYSNTIDVFVKNENVSVSVFEDVSKHTNFILRHIPELRDKKSTLNTDKQNSRPNKKEPSPDKENPRPNEEKSSPQKENPIPNEGKQQRNKVRHNIDEEEFVADNVKLKHDEEPKNNEMEELFHRKVLENDTSSKTPEKKGANSALALNVFTIAQILYFYIIKIVFLYCVNCMYNYIRLQKQSKYDK